jgi:hypothetical protein
MLMEARTRRVMTLAVVFATSVMALLSGAATANAERGTPPPADVETSGQIITVSVWGTGSQSGASGSGGGGRVSVSVPAPCWMSGWSTGKEYYEYVATGLMARDNHHYGENMTPLPKYETYKDDVTGHWYSAECSSANWPDQNDTQGWRDFVLKFFAAHPAVYVPADQTPPAPYVPPELLRDIAIKNLTLPDPQLDWNPKRTGNQGTLVNLDTWFWLDDAPTTLQVHAAAGGNEASVTALFGGMDITAPGEEPLSCPGPGTAYTSGAHATTCALAFSRASSALGAEATPVTVQTRWTGTWAADGVEQGPLTPQPAPVTATVDIRVDEVQTLVTGTG